MTAPSRSFLIPHRHGIAQALLTASSPDGARHDVARVLMCALASAHRAGWLPPDDGASIRMAEAEVLGTIPPGLAVVWGEAFELVSGLHAVGCCVFGEDRELGNVLLGCLSDERGSQTWPELARSTDPRAHAASLRAAGVEPSQLAPLGETLWALVVRLLDAEGPELPDNCVLAVLA